jgi:hypothetical protein
MTVPDTAPPIDREQATDDPSAAEEKLTQAVQATWRHERDWPFPLHSPLPPSSLQGDRPAGFDARDLPQRCTVTLSSLADTARPAQSHAKGDRDRTGRRVGLPTAEVLHSSMEWFDRKPQLNAPQGPIRHRATLRAIEGMDPDAARRLNDAAPEWMAALDKACNRQAHQTGPKQASARIFSPSGSDLARYAAGGAQPLASEAEQAQVAAVLQQPAGAAQLMARIFEKAVRAHLGRPVAARPADEHRLVACTLGLLPAVLLHGQPTYQLAAATVLRGRPPRVPQPLADGGLPRCFQAQTLQSPASLAAQARSALGGSRVGAEPDADASAEQQPLLALLDTVLALARDLVRIVTDPLRAHALGFDAGLFREWANQLENDLKESRLPARLKKAGDENTAAYLVFDLLPRLHRWKSHHRAMAGPELADRASGSAIGYAQALQAAIERVGYRPALPDKVLVQHGRPGAGS